MGHREWAIVMPIKAPLFARLEIVCCLTHAMRNGDPTRTYLITGIFMLTFKFVVLSLSYRSYCMCNLLYARL